MDLRLLAAISGELEGLNVAARYRERGVSRKTFYKWRERYRIGGAGGLEERSRRPKRSPQRIADHVEDAIIESRKQLLDYGLDAGTPTIRWHLRGRVSPVPSEATIWRALVWRGHVTPEPKKRPKRSYRRFAAEHPNECWQIDVTALRRRSPVTDQRRVSELGKGPSVGLQAELYVGKHRSCRVVLLFRKRYGDVLPSRCR